MTSGWWQLLLASLFEIAMAIALKQADGWTRFWPGAVGLASALTSMVLLTFALRQLPVGVAYAVWTGIGTAGVAILGVTWFGESASLVRFVFMGLILGGTVGLQLTSR